MLDGLCQQSGFTKKHEQLTQVLRTQPELFEFVSQKIKTHGQNFAYICHNSTLPDPSGGRITSSSAEWN